MVTGQAGILFLQRKAEVIGRVAGCFNRLERPARAFKHVAIIGAFIRREARIILAAKFALGCRFTATLGVDFTARPVGQWLGQRRVIGMPMRDENILDRFAFKRGFQRFEMGFIMRAGIDHGDFAMADNIDARSDIGERTRIVGDDAPDQWRDLLHFSIFKFDFTHKRNGHGSLLSCFF